jgi:peroxin-4
MTANNRLMKELKEAMRNKDPDIQLSADENFLFKWTATLQGPPDTPYMGGSYTVTLRIPSDYPMEPPTATFNTKVFHPNVNFSTGEVCLDILKSTWSPAWTLVSVCRAILTLMAHPEADSPLNCDAGNLIRANDTEGYNSIARMYAITEAGAPHV